MDLSHDWKTFNDVLFAKDTSSTGPSTLILIEEGGKVRDGVLSSGASFLATDLETPLESTHKEKLDAYAAKYGVERTLLFSKKAIDQAAVDASLMGTNYFQQLESIRNELFKNKNAKASKDLLAPTVKHFILDLFSKSYTRLIFPRRFNILVFVDHKPDGNYQAILLSYSSGKLDQFYEPDFSSLHENRLSDWKSETHIIGQYLENRYLQRCYCIFMHKEDWDQCLHAEKSSWRVFTRFYYEGRAAIYPRNILTKSYLAAHRVIRYLTRA